MTSIGKAPGVATAIRRAIPPGVPVQFLGVGGLFLIGAGLLSSVLTGGVATAGTLAALSIYGIAILLGLRALRGYPHRAIGLCNVVTLFRLMLVSALIATLVTPGAGPWIIFNIATIALCLDGIDGWLARRGGYISEFGATFDMEVDAMLAMVLALLAYFGGQVGAFILLLGLPHYIFRVAKLRFPWLMAELPPRFSRKVVCVVQIATLIAVLTPMIDRPVSDVLAATAALLLVWSFALDIRWLRMARA